MSKQLVRNVVSGFNMQAALLSPAHAELLVESIQYLANANVKEENEYAKNSASELVATYGYTTTLQEKPFAYADGLAYIPITGLLINRFNSSWGFVTGYNFIRTQLNAALEDVDVKAIVFDVNSGGGQVAGCFELATEIYKSRDIKPSIAVVDAASYSAAYALASSASKVIVTPSGGVGSIGAVIMHMEYSNYLKDVGIKVTMVFAGDKKVDGNPYESLSESAKVDMQTTVDEARTKFVDLVSMNRGLEAQVVFDTQAQCYSVSEALQLGLIDGIATPIDAVVSFLNELESSDITEKEIEMSNKTTNQPSAESSTVASEEKTVTKVETVDTKALVTAERTRINGILSCEEAKDKSSLANHLALNTELSIDEAKNILKASASEKKEVTTVKADTNILTAAMDSTANPQVGADTGEVTETAAQRILKAQAVATGKPLVK